MLERSLRSVPKRVTFLLIIGLILQVTWHHLHPTPVVTIHTLNPPPKIELMRVLSFGEPIASAKILMLWLQSFNSQQGHFVLYREMDYAILIQWLEHILQLDPKGQYPLFAASRLYSIVPDPTKQRQISEFVYQQFFVDPSRRWPWLAQVAILAQYRLKDLPLALKYAQALTTYAPADAPYWVQEMQIFVLEEMGELKQAETLLKLILSSERITDTEEIIFLKGILKDLQKKMDEFYPR